MLERTAIRRFLILYGFVAYLPLAACRSLHIQMNKGATSFTVIRPVAESTAR